MSPRSTPPTPLAGLRSRMLACAVVSAALAGIGTVDAAAHTANVATQHSLTSTSGGFAGQLTSALVECVSGRSITLYRADAAGAVAVASATSDSHGAWSQPADTLSAGAYYALAARFVKTSAGHKHTCEAARSNTGTLPPDSDGDGVRDPSDNCPTAVNPGQRDGDGDGLGDACDPDADGDGYTVTGGDCADEDPARHPGASDDTSNGIDDDCDGKVDEDFDGDGDGYAPAQGDCNDANGGMSPGAAEADNGIDDDCDGTVDEGFGSVESCWVASSEPVVATSTWSQTATSDPCTYRLTVYTSVLPGSVFMVSSEWMIEYRTAGPRGPVAFHYDGRDWAYFATHANAIVCTCDPPSDEGGEGF
jgi:hypothetical protein